MPHPALISSNSFSLHLIYCRLSVLSFSVQAMNAASFGKAFRGTFEDIQTRRLGVRGNSKYHCQLSIFFVTSFSDQSLIVARTLWPTDCGIQPRTLYEVRNLASFGDGPGGQHWVLSSSSSSNTVAGRARSNTLDRQRVDSTGPAINTSASQVRESQWTVPHE